jgi:hypothetical protein
MPVTDMRLLPITDYVEADGEVPMETVAEAAMLIRCSQAKRASRPQGPLLYLVATPRHPTART